MFSGCNFIEHINLSYLDTSNVIDMSNIFSKCNFKSFVFPNINTSSLKNASGMFDSCKKLITLDLSNLNTSNVNDMSSMFSWCSSLLSPLVLLPVRRRSFRMNAVCRDKKSPPRHCVTMSGQAVKSAVPPGFVCLTIRSLRASCKAPAFLYRGPLCLPYFGSLRFGSPSGARSLFCCRRLPPSRLSVDR